MVGQALKAGKIKLDDMVTIGKDAWATGNPRCARVIGDVPEAVDQVSARSEQRGNYSVNDLFSIAAYKQSEELTYQLLNQAADLELRAPVQNFPACILVMREAPLSA